MKYVLSLIVVLCLVSVSEAQLFGGRLCNRGESRSQVSMNDVIRVNYYMQHLEAVQQISSATEGIRDEIAQTNQLLQEQAMLTVMRALIERRAQAPVQLPVQLPAQSPVVIYAQQRYQRYQQY